VTTSCWLSVAAIALGATAAGCGDDSPSNGGNGGNGGTGTGGGGAATDGEKAAAKCSGGASELRASFRPLPEGLRYRPLPANVERQAESRLDDRFAGFDGRQIVRGGVPVGAVTVYIVAEPIEDEREHLEGFANGFAKGAEAEEVTIDGVQATRVDGPEQSAVVRIFERCRVVGVVAPSGARAQRIARTVLR
jgi:hypothetical protein